MELDAIAGVYIGGTSAAGGVASVAGSVVGAIMLVVIRSGLNFVLAKSSLDINSTYVTFVLTGVIVVVAVLMDVIKNKNASKVKVETEAAKYKRTAKEKLEELNGELDLALTDGSMNPQQRQEKAAALRKEIEAFKAASKTEYARLKQAKK